MLLINYVLLYFFRVCIPKKKKKNKFLDRNWVIFKIQTGQQLWGLIYYQLWVKNMTNEDSKHPLMEKRTVLMWLNFSNTTASGQRTRAHHFTQRPTFESWSDSGAVHVRLFPCKNKKMKSELFMNSCATVVITKVPIILIQKKLSVLSMDGYFCFEWPCQHF